MMSVTHYFENLRTSQLPHIVRVIYNQLRGSWYFHFLYEISSSSLLYIVVGIPVYRSLT